VRQHLPDSHISGMDLTSNLLKIPQTPVPQCPDLFCHCEQPLGGAAIEDRATDCPPFAEGQWTTATSLFCQGSRLRLLKVGSQLCERRSLQHTPVDYCHWHTLGTDHAPHRGDRNVHGPVLPHRELTAGECDLCRQACRSDRYRGVNPRSVLEVTPEQRGALWENSTASLASASGRPITATSWWIGRPAR
jgi:hypothetical protein